MLSGAPRIGEILTIATVADGAGDGGADGVGAAVVNALSEKMWVEVHRDSKVYRQEYARGKAVGNMKTKPNGNGAHADWWSFIAPFFAAHYRVAALSWSGMGGSDWREHYTLEAFVDEMHREPDRFALIG